MIIKNIKNKLFFLVLFCYTPFYSFSLSNPFLFYFSINLTGQILAGIIIFIPFWFLKIKTGIIQLNNKIKKIIYFFTIFLIILFLNIHVKDKTIIQHAINKKDQYDSIFKPLGKKAKIIGLDKNDILIDINLPRYYNLYHIDGSCNLNPHELLNNKNLRNNLEKYDGKIFIICEWRKHVFDFYNELLDKNVSPDKWQILEAGQMFYKILKINKKDKSPPNIINKKMEFDEAYKNRKMINFAGKKFSNFKHEALIFPKDINYRNYYTLGQEICYKFGPRYSKGWIFSIIGNNKVWKELPFSFFYNKKYQKVVKIFIDDCSQPPFRMRPEEYCVINKDDIYIYSGYININLEKLDKIAGKKIEEAVFICDNNQSSFAAESLALDLLNRGGKIYGYIIGYSQIHKMLSNKKIKFFFNFIKYFYGFEYIVLILIIIFIVKFNKFLFSNLKRIDYINITTYKKINKIVFIIKSFLFRMIGFLYIICLGLLLFKIGNISLSLNNTILGTNLQDVTRLNLPLLSIIPLLTYILLFRNIIRFTPKRHNILFKIIIFLVMIYITNKFIYTYINNSIYLFSAISFLLILLIHDFWENIYNIFYLYRIYNINKSIFTLIPLNLVDKIKFTGQKATYLNKIKKIGFNIPEGYALITTIDDFIKNYKAGNLEKNKYWIKIVKELKNKFSKQNLIIRSSTPDEDMIGNLKAGVYTSVANVNFNNLNSSIFKVLTSYKTKGVNPSIKVGVIIQVLLDFNCSGVAIREEINLGSNILVEAAKGNNFLITSGRGAKLVGRIGSISNKWISGNLIKTKKIEKNIVKAFTIIEKNLKNPINIEWGLLNNNFILLQARKILYKNNDLMINTPAYTLNLLKTDLKKHIYNNKIILDIGELVDYQYNTSIATIEFIEKLYSYKGPQTLIGGIFYKLLSNIGPEPSIAKIFNGLYFNLVPKRPFLFIIIKPFINTTNLFLKITLKYRLLNLEKRIINSKDICIEKLKENELNNNKKTQILAKGILSYRKELLKREAKHLFEIALIIKIYFKKKAFTQLKNMDPFLSFLANTNKSKNKDEFYYRSLQEFSIDLPRYGEKYLTNKKLILRGNNDIQRISINRPDIKNKKDFILYLQALARDNFSFGVFNLRLKYLLLGKITGLKKKIFNLNTERLIELSNGKKLKPINNPVNNNAKNLPPKFTLQDLENWSANDFLELPDKETPFWVSGGNKNLQGTIVENISYYIKNYKTSILLLKYPLVEIIYKLPINSTVIALSGNRLCHAALIAKEKNINALFNANLYKNILNPGNIIKISKKGKITLIEKK